LADFHFCVKLTLTRNLKIVSVCELRLSPPTYHSAYEHECRGTSSHELRRYVSNSILKLNDTSFNSRQMSPKNKLRLLIVKFLLFHHSPFSFFCKNSRDYIKVPIPCSSLNSVPTPTMSNDWYLMPDSNLMFVIIWTASLTIFRNISSHPAV
jgi:hypothetical protein